MDLSNPLLGIGEVALGLAAFPSRARRLAQPKNHSHEQEDARRRRQIARGVLRLADRGRVPTAAKRKGEVV
jgi:hypothetical protein